MDALAGRVCFIGRDVELGILRKALAEASAGRPGFVLVTGEGGIGKTCLLQRFLRGASDVCRVTAGGDESEKLLPYGVLEQLARSPDRPPPFELPLLTRPSSSRCDPIAMGTALLELLRALEQRTVVVLVVDDAHLADEPSLLALLFALRRFGAARVLTLLSAPEERCGALPEGLRRLIDSDAGATLRLEGFGEREFRELMSALDLPLSGNLTRRLREHCGGNFRHARALVAEVGVDALRRLGELPWPAPKALARQVLDQVDACPPTARRLLAAAAVLGSPCQLAVLQQLGGVEEPLDALQAAIDHGLLAYRDREVAFPRTVLCGAVYHGLTLAERAELHARAAALSDDEGAALSHRAAATTDLDEGLGSAIADLARRQGARGDWVGAALLFEKAAALLPPGCGRERTVLEAAESRLLAGDVDGATWLIRDTGYHPDGARCRYVLGRVTALEGRHEDARLLLTQALDACNADVDASLEAKIAVELARLEAHLLRPHAAVTWAQRARVVAEGTSLAQPALPYLAFGLAATGHPSRAVSLVHGARVDVRDRSEPETAYHLVAEIVALLYAGELEPARDQAADLVSLARRSGQLPAHAKGLALLAFVEYRLGSWVEAMEHADLAIALADGAGLASSRSLVHAVAVWARAGRGEWRAAEAHVSEAVTAASRPIDIALAKMADAVVGSARDQHRRVVEAVEALRSLGAPHALDEPGGLWPWHEVYVDALIALGLLTRAGEEVARITGSAGGRATRSVTSTALRLRASIEAARGRGDEADEAFRAALDHAEGVPEPFNRALLHASYGAFLRRGGQRSAAAAELDIARALFVGLGASPSVDRCDRELASTRPRAGRPPGGQSGQLTPREAWVARLVCEGKRNREVATELVVSENTVEYHLKHIYAKLGIASRSELIIRLGAGATSVGAR